MQHAETQAASTRPKMLIAPSKIYGVGVEGAFAENWGSDLPCAID